MNASRQRWGIWLFVVCLTVAALGLGIGAPAAHADSLWSAWGGFTVIGHDYLNRAAVTVFDDGSGARGRTRVDTQSGGNVSIDTWRIQARLYNGSNVEMAHSNWEKNPTVTNTFYALTPIKTNHGYYYGQGTTGAWNGSDYTYYYTFSSDTLHNPL